MDIAKLIERQQAELRRRLDLLTNNDLAQLQASRAEYQTKIDEIDSSINKICIELGISTFKPDGSKSSDSKKDRAPRLSGTEISKRITEELQNSPAGLSQTEISLKTGVSYPSVINFIRDNAALLKVEGSRKSKKISLA